MTKKNVKESARPSVFIVEDHPFARAYLSTLINAQADLRVCGEAEDAAGALAGIAREHPALVITDLNLGGKPGLELVKDIKAANSKQRVLVFSAQDETLYAERVIQAGATGYVMKSRAVAEVLKAIQSVLTGRIYLSPEMTERALQRSLAGQSRTGGSPPEALTDRELEVFEMIGDGKETKDIAAALHLDVKTVETYRARIKDKLQFESGHELHRAAFRWMQEKGS